ncbi:hypothetical protein WA026_020113 [Henosepilachna vigintioctopunctata]|uniref:dihydrolipoyl dehydrogenase n=1 Tax=Henosepilachna vigintioctopunctata TaxID=420089 RepID=A0AAW1U2C0_9CUCU
MEKMMCAKSKVTSGFSGVIEDIFRTVGIRIVRGTARFTGCKQLTVQGCDGSVKIVEAENIIIATGSTSRHPGFEVDEVQIISSDGALIMKKIPKNLVVLGGGIISIELAFLWNKLGSKVTILTNDSLIGIPIIDKEIRCQFQQILEQQGMKIMTNTRVLCVQKCEKRVKVEVEDDRGENRQQLLCDVLLACAGRVPYTTGLNLDRVGIQTDKNGHIPVYHNYQTCTPNIYAVGDVAPGPMTAHKAIEEGLLCVDGLCGLPTYLDINNLPMAIYTYPALTSIGKTEEQLQNECIPYKVSWSYMKTNLRAHIDMDTRGSAKALICPKTDHILGTHIIAENATEMINEVVLAKQYGITADKVARVMHTHPSFAKLLKSLYGR